MDKLAEEVIRVYGKSGKTIATAESCTGGMVGAALTAVSGSSSVYMGGIISYTNQVKHRQLGVKQEFLDRFGAVSEEVAKAMAQGAKKALETNVAVSVTGVAGPNSDDWNNPVGLVYIATCSGDATICHRCNFQGDRQSIRRQAMEEALTMLLNLG